MVSASMSGLTLWMLSFFAQPPESTEAAQFAHERLHLLALIAQVLALLLSPALSATSIAGERESGLLEGVQLSHLRPFEIVWGKWLSSLAFALLLCAVTLPPLTIWLSLSGITPHHMCSLALAGVLVTTTSASIGLFCSAWSWRANIAMRSAYGLTFAWIIGSLNAWTLATQSQLFLVPARVTIPAWLETPLVLFGLSNPLITSALQWLPSTQMATRASNAAWVLDVPLFWFNAAFQILLSMSLLVLAAGAVRKPFTERFWIEPRLKARQRRPQSTLKQGISNVRDNADAIAAVDKDKNSGWWEIPVGALFRFHNPVLAREFGGKFRMRQVPMAVIVAEVLLAMVVLFFYLQALWWALFDPPTRPMIWWALSFFGLIVVMTASAIMGASAFSREREAGTWEAIRLSLLSPREIIAGKSGALLWACALFAVPFWPVLAACLHPSLAPQRGVSLHAVAATAAILGATAWCYSAWGMLLSWRCAKTSSATLWAMGSLVAADIFVPLVAGAIAPRSWVAATNIWYNPSLALLQMMDANSESLLWSRAAPVSLFLLAAGMLFLGILHTLMRRDEKHSPT
ncbi:MAG: type transport system permease protein [Abditibacteriota bacterium]|nr:type transport system permease protein [Abditibacteriota bacterium]